MNLLRLRPSPALVIACIALFVAMGGVSYGFATGSIDTREIKNDGVLGKDIRDGTLTTKDIRNNEVRGADIRNSTIGGRDVAFNTLGGQDIKESTLGKVPAAVQADNAVTLGGVPASGYARAEAPSFSPLPGATPGDAPPGYDVDAIGYVHLQGSLTNRNFTLPVGARPANTSRFIVERGGTGGQAEVLTIAPDGTAAIAGQVGGAAALDGLTFAAAP